MILFLAALNNIPKDIIDDYKELIINKLETIPGITAYSIYYFLKLEKGYTGSYETIKNFSVCNC